MRAPPSGPADAVRARAGRDRRAAVLDAVAAARPDAIVHQMTALAGLSDPRRFERAFAATNRLRTEGTEHLRARKFPVVGDGGGVWSFVHIEDAAAATLAALEHWSPGEIYNVVDDEPAPVREWLPAIADAIGAPSPRRIPRWVARLMGEHVVALMCEVRGASNAKARRELGWTPRWPTWRDGFGQLATRAPTRAAS